MTKKRAQDRPATIDGSTLKPLPAPRRIDLKTLEQVRAEMARIYRDMRQGRIESQDGTRYAYVLDRVAKLIELGDLERRLDQLEEHIHGND